MVELSKEDFLDCFRSEPVLSEYEVYDYEKCLLVIDSNRKRFSFWKEDGKITSISFSTSDVDLNYHNLNILSLLLNLHNIENKVSLSRLKIIKKIENSVYFKGEVFYLLRTPTLNFRKNGSYYFTWKFEIQNPNDLSRIKFSLTENQILTKKHLEKMDEIVKTFDLRR